MKIRFAVGKFVFVLAALFTLAACSGSALTAEQQVKADFQRLDAEKWANFVRSLEKVEIHLDYGSPASAFGSFSVGCVSCGPDFAADLDLLESPVFRNARDFVKTNGRVYFKFVKDSGVFAFDKQGVKHTVWFDPKDSKAKIE